MRIAGGGGSLVFLPIPGMSKVPFGTPKALADNLHGLNAFQVHQIESHAKNHDPGNPRDFIDMYLNKMTGTKVCFGISYTSTKVIV